MKYNYVTCDRHHALDVLVEGKRHVEYQYPYFESDDWRLLNHETASVLFVKDMRFRDCVPIKEATVEESAEYLSALIRETQIPTSYHFNALKNFAAAIKAEILAEVAK